MKIKRLEISGFKSFVDKAVLDFQHGITGVVGPNGCGKSNIVDAIRWVMGEQNARHLRGRMMEDVIFGGSEVRKPHGLARVSVVFDNSAGLCPPSYKEFSEIMVTRCLHRSGESEYLINKTPCRLMDITELFMDTGVGARAYSIIEQGKVGMLISAKPEERRGLIEEAAGVTKFKSRKKNALRKMDATRQNLVRLGDIITEVRRQIGSLKRQAQKAEKFRDYRIEVKRIEIGLGGNRYQQLQQECSLVGQRQHEQAEILARLDARLEQGELQLSEQQLLLSSAESDFNQRQEQSWQLGAEVQRVEGELLLAQRQQEHYQSQQEEMLAEGDALTERVTSLQEEETQLEQRRQETFTRLETLRQKLEDDESEVQERLERERQLNRDYEDCRGEIMELLAQSGRLSNRREEIGRRLDSENERRIQIEAQAGSVQDQCDQLGSRREILLQRLDESRQALEDQSAQLEEWRQLRQAKDEQLRAGRAQSRTLQQELDKARSRQESLEELQRSGEGFAAGTQQLLAASDGGVLVANLLRVGEEYETLVELVLGARLQALVAQPDQALSLLDKLQGQSARASLLIATQRVEVPDLDDATVLTQLVSIDAECEQPLLQLLEGTYLVDDIQPWLSRSLAVGMLLVDRKGYCLDWRGVLSGGDDKAGDSGVLRRHRQLEETSVLVEAKEREYRLAAQRCDASEEELLELDEQCSYATTAMHRLELQLVELGKDRQGLQAEEERLNNQLALAVHDIEQIDELHKTLTVEQEQLSQQFARQEESRQLLEERSLLLKGQLDEMRSGLDERREQLTGRRVAVAEMQQQHRGTVETAQRLQQQVAELMQRDQQLRQRSENAQRSIAEFRTSEEKLELEVELLVERRQQSLRHSDDARHHYEQQKVQMEELRERLRKVRSEAEELRKEVARLQVRCHELEVDSEHLRQNVIERYRVDLAEHRVPEATEDEQQRQQAQLTRLQQRIDALGEVNLTAIEEYQEQEERYDFLCRQREDLNHSLDDLNKAISQINRTTRRRFKETFDQVNEKFKQVFPRLFRGGVASLRLSDENDLLETGIDIVVQPPGKRLQNVNLLSGGEKALTAVALIFSLFLIKPTPFCILDEVDAPLDDANIDRFAEMVRDMTEQSQFIIITHSKRTMSIVDTMYGVTMQEAGVSRLVSVRLNGFLEQKDSALSA